MIFKLLMDGYGVEDISLKVGIPASEMRFVVTLLRENGSLETLIKKARCDFSDKGKLGVSGVERNEKSQAR